MNYIRLVCRLRSSNLIDLDPASQEGKKFERVLLKAIDKKIEQQKREDLERMGGRRSVGPYSGLTREELRRTGTCETDWF